MYILSYFFCVKKIIIKKARHLNDDDGYIYYNFIINLYVFNLNV